MDIKDINFVLKFYKQTLALQKMGAEYKNDFIRYGLWTDYQEEEILKIPETEKMILCVEAIKDG